MNREPQQAIERIRVSLRAAAGEQVPRADCPPGARLWEAVAGELSPKEVGELTDHVASCLLCGQLWEVARELREEPQSPPVVLQGPSPRRDTHLWWRYGRLAAALLIVAVGLFAVRLWAPSEDTEITTLRGVEGFSLRLSTPKTLPRRNFLLRWGEIPDGVRCEVRVVWSTEEDQELVDEVEDLHAAEYLVPEEKLRVLSTGSRLRYTVVAFHRGLEISSKSGIVELE